MLYPIHYSLYHLTFVYLDVENISLLCKNIFAVVHKGVFAMESRHAC